MQYNFETNSLDVITFHHAPGHAKSVPYNVQYKSLRVDSSSHTQLQLSYRFTLLKTSLPQDSGRKEGRNQKGASTYVDIYQTRRAWPFICSLSTGRNSPLNSIIILHWIHFLLFHILVISSTCGCECDFWKHVSGLFHAII